ncbi:hypothetical protein EW146_g6309 [Bondarzewia mesenterica]|uniref:C3HC-type domain-containing protein n=1 Tax=Bondarzewia mesenterica TaxID=1095465 RepID=A0A4V3XEK1_9AGAM|nr:hypothetical protein EW146_g6309 [Bondarzewia mesenterica]
MTSTQTVTSPALNRTEGSLASPQIEPSASTSSVKSNKRKLADAIQKLDEAVAPRTDDTDRPSPAKKQHTARSLYSTLAKYGIKSKQPAPADFPTPKAADLSKTPHLAAILARTASKTRNAFPLRFRSQTPHISSSTLPSSEYRPSSTTSFLSRLATFKLKTYSNKPPAIDAVAAAKCGWTNDGKDRLVAKRRCEYYPLSLSGFSANALVEKQRVQLVEMHKDGCPWKTRQCDADVYRILLSSPAAMAREIKTRALTLEPVLEGIDVKHPLSQKQVQQLKSIIASIRMDGYHDPAQSTDGGTSLLAFPSLIQEPSQTAILTAFFGWSLAPPVPPAQHSRTPTISRANSVTFSVPSTPRTPSRLGGKLTPSVSASRLSLSRMNSAQRSPTGSVVGEQKRDSSLLHCALCHRRLGLWAVGPSPSRAKGQSPSAPAPPTRQIDLLREHRPYCPYVVRSTSVPSLPVPQSHAQSDSRTKSSITDHNGSLVQMSGGQPGAMEGWRAVWTVVTRYRMGQKKRDELLREVDEHVGRAESASPDSSFVLVRSETAELLVPTEGGGGAGQGSEMDVDADVDSVEAMMAGVKSKGGKELLKECSPAFFDVLARR